MIGRRRALMGLTGACTIAAPRWARAQPRARRVVFINPGRTGEDFWEDVSEAMRAAADQLGFLLEIRMAERERNRIRAMGIAAAQEDPAPDALLLVNEEQSAGPAVLAAAQRKIPTLMVLNELVGEDAAQIGRPRENHPSFLGNVLPDNRKAGRQMAEVLFAEARRGKWHAADGKLHILGLAGEMATPAGVERSIGMREAVAAAGDVVLDRHLNAGWNGIEARRLTRRYLDWALRASIRPCGVWAANDPMALGAIEAFEDSGLLPGQDAAFVGLNWSADALRAIDAGKLLMTQGGHLLGGAWALVLLRDWFEGIDFAEGGEATLRFDMAGLCRLNVAAYEAALGQQDWTSIDFRRFTKLGRRKRNENDVGYDFSLSAILAACGPSDRQIAR